MKRQIAWRVFASEYNDCSLETKTSDENLPDDLSPPTKVVSPLGANINRVYIAGVLTDVENLSDDGSFVRAHLSDPTGVFTLYSGQFQPELTEQLQTLEVPAFVAIVGKARTYVPEEGELYVSVRPESLHPITSDQRDEWIIETSKHTLNRLNAIKEAQQLTEPSAQQLKKLGYPEDLSEGIIQALKHYSTIDLQKYENLIRESLHYINNDLPAPAFSPTPASQQEVASQPTKEATTPKEDKKQQQDNKELETYVMQTIQKLEGDEGAEWDSILKSCTKDYNETQIEETLNSLMDKGYIFEPILGVIKTT